jgi:succinoglycan biosynthesis protein ExoH
MPNDISRRIAIARYLAILAVVFIHVQPTDLAQLDRVLVDDSFFDRVRTFLTYGLFKYALPLLTAISAWLLFSANLDRNYTALVAKKTKTLLIPLLVWNIPVAIGIYFAQKTGVLGSFLTQLYPFDADQWLSAVLAVYRPPVNSPLYFLRDLFVLALLAPAFGLMLRSRPFLGALIVIFVCWSNIDGALVLQNRLMVSFYIGGMAAVMKWDLRALDKYAIPLLALLLAMALAIAIIDTRGPDWLRAISAFWVWPIFSLLEKSRISDLIVRASGKSFYIFVTHSVILFAVWKIYQPFAASSHYPIFWFASPFIVVAFCHLTLRPFEWLAPKFAALALGNRIDPDVPRNRQHADWELIPLGIEQVDLRGPLLNVNHRLCEMLGYPRKELEQLSFRDITHPEDLIHEEKLLSALIEGRIRSYSIEKRYLHSSGIAIPVRVTSSQLSGSTREGGFRISIIEEIEKADKRVEGKVRGSRIAAIACRVSGRRWRGLNETIGNAIRECFEYRDRAQQYGGTLKLRTMI